MLVSPRKIYESVRTRTRSVISNWTPQAYEDVPQEKDDLEEEQGQGLISENTERAHDELDRSSISDSLRRHRWTISITLGTVVAFCIMLIPILIRQVHHHKVWTSCGDSPETARERGCHFDLISFAWQTHECYDSSLVAEFAEWEPWPFWTSENGTETVPLEVAFLGERTLWIPWRYHIVHCTFVWRQLHRAYEAGWVDSDLRRYGHTKHCQRMILMEGEETDDGRFFSIPNDRVVTLANIIYPSCEKLGKGSTTSSWWDSVPPR